MSSETNAPVDQTGAKILLFPLCDRRGMIRDLLLTDVEPGIEVENLFFAWLLDLPATVDPGEAAQAIFTVTRNARHLRDRTSKAQPSVALTAARQKLYRLLAETCVPKTESPRKLPQSSSARALKNAHY